jgi:hypothetical protein
MIKLMIMIRDPMPLEQLMAKLQKLNLPVSNERKRWLKQHHEHQHLQLGRDRFYCRTCRAVG